MTDKPMPDPDEAQKRSGTRLRAVLMRKKKDPPGQVWRDIDDRNNFGPAFFRAAMGGSE